jgi:hypothetical protein
MSAQPLEELRQFHQFLSEKVQSTAELSPEEALDEWRQAHPATFDEDVAAIREALDARAGSDPGQPFEEFDREFRKRHNIPG